MHVSPCAYDEVHEGHVTKWWFILRREEQLLERKWSAIAACADCMETQASANRCYLAKPVELRLWLSRSQWLHS